LLKKKVTSITKPVNCKRHTASCILRTAYCTLPVFLILSFFATTALAQPNTRLDSLENAIRHAKGTQKADLMIESIHYQWRKMKTLYREPFVDASRLAYQFSKIINYREGMAESGKLLIHAFRDINERDSVRYYLEESLRLFTAINDSANLAGIYWLYAGAEKVDGNYNKAVYYAGKSFDIGMALNNISIQISALEYFGDIYKAMGDFSGEEKVYLKLIELNTLNNFNSSRVLISLARYYINLGNYEDGIRYSLMADSAIGILEDAFALEYPDKTFMKAKMKGNVARAYRLWGYYDSALVWHRKAIAGMESAFLKSNVDIPNQWEGIGYVYTQKGIFDSARIYLDKSARVREGFSDFIGAGESYDGLGYLSWLIGDEEGAVNYYRKAIELKSVIPEPQASYRRATFKESLSVSYLRLGQAYASWGMPETAMQNLEKSVTLCREIGNRKGEAEAIIEFGKIKEAAGDHSGAENDFKNALRIFTEINYRPGQADAIGSLGDPFYTQGDFQKSLDYYRQSERILLETQDPISLAETWIKVGSALVQLENFGPAGDYLMMALNQAKKYHLVRRKMQAQFALAELYKRSGNKATAIECLSEYLSLRDSVNRQKTYYLLADIQSKHESELSQQQKELLQKEEEVKDLKLSRSNGMLTGAFGLILLLILLSISIFRTIRLKDAHREAMLQQRLLRARLSPEFVSYSLGNVKNMVRESKITGASDYITYFSRMMQHMLEGSRQELVVFSKGIAMLKSYLELLKLSQEGSFGYLISVDQNIDAEETMVPSFLEEVIVPGFKAETGQRFIKIAFTAQEKTMHVCVESRGHVAEARGLSEQDMKSLKAIRSRLSGMQKKYHVKLGFDIGDIYDENGRMEGKRLDFEVPAVFD
jgi:tetratricopeptide (TPR) repeat protein